MATASVSSASALLQKASQQYLECRRKVSAKVDEVKTLESEIQTLFAHITALGESGARATKSVGRLELEIVTVEGEAPVDDAVVSVEIDPEYEEPEELQPEKQATEAEATQPTETKATETEATETEAEAETQEKATNETQEDAADEQEAKAEEPEEATEAAAAAEEEKVEEAKLHEKPRRSVQWNNGEGFPLKVVFDPVQSREAVVTITIAPQAKDGEDVEPVKEFRIPVSSLFQTGSINRWYVLKRVKHVHVDKAALTEVADEDEAEKPAETEADKKEAAEEDKKTEDAAEDKKEKEEKEEAGAAKPADGEEESAEKKADATEGEEPVTDVPVAPQQTLIAAEATVESEDKVVVLKESKLHALVHFTMSEIEKLSQTAIALSQRKQEAEAALAVLEREALSLRTRYERLNASQRSVGAGGGVVKPRATLLGGRGLAGAARVEKSTYQKVKDSVAAVFTPQRTQVLTSFAIFCGSVALFHYQGDNLLA